MCPCCTEDEEGWQVRECAGGLWEQRSDSGWQPVRNRNFSPTVIRNWFLPTTWMILEVRASPEPSYKSPVSLHLDLGLGIDTLTRTQPNPPRLLASRTVRAVGKMDLVYTTKFVIIGYAAEEMNAWVLESDKYGFVSRICRSLSVWAKESSLGFLKCGYEYNSPHNVVWGLRLPMVGQLAWYIVSVQYILNKITNKHFNFLGVFSKSRLIKKFLKSKLYK